MRRTSINSDLPQLLLEQGVEKNSKKLNQEAVKLTSGCLLLALRAKGMSGCEVGRHSSTLHICQISLTSFTRLRKHSPNVQIMITLFPLALSRGKARGHPQVPTTCFYHPLSRYSSYEHLCLCSGPSFLLVSKSHLS